MTTTQSLKLDVRAFTGYDEGDLPPAELESAINRAEKHLRAEKPSLTNEFDFRDDRQGEEALF